MRTDDPSFGAWRDGDIITLSALTLIGVAMILGAWYGASGSSSLAHQMAWLNLGVGGLIVSAAGNSLWLLRGRAAVGTQRVTLVRWERPQPQRSASAELATSGFPATVRVTGTDLVHRSDCPLVTNKVVEPAEPSSAKSCAVCTP